MSSYRTGQYKFRILSSQEQKQLPVPVQEWIQKQKKFRGKAEFSWADKTYLLLSLGMRPNPGYRLEVVKIEDGEQGITVFIEEKLPLPGRMYPQVIVYPYMVAEVKGPVEVWLVLPDQSTVPFP